MALHDPIVVVAASRTALGSFQGELSSLAAPELGAAALKGALAQAAIKPESISEVIMGCVLPAGLGQAPARQAALQAGIPVQAGCTTVNKVCGSGMKAIMMGMDAIIAGNAEIAAAGGMESMSNAPYLLDKARQGYRVGHGKILDHMFLDGLEDAYGKDSRGKLMGAFAEDTAKHYQFTRADQDAFALLSVERAKKAIAEGCFKEEITALETADRKGKKIIVQDESPGKIDPAKIPTLKPAFAPDGTITAASSSSISDGAAALILMTESRAKKLNLKPLARIIAAATESREPKWFTTAPIGAIEKILTKANWKKDQVDLFEINEAFAVVTMAAMKELNLTSGKVNIHGGACALGHPIGASGARIVVTLIHALRRHALKKGIAALCIGGGEATALAVEII